MQTVIIKTKLLSIFHAAYCECLWSKHPLCVHSSYNLSSTSGPDREMFGQASPAQWLYCSEWPPRGCWKTREVNFGQILNTLNSIEKIYMMYIILQGTKCTYNWLTQWRQDKMATTLADNTFKYKFFNENVSISIKNSLKFVLKGAINNIPVLVQIRGEMIHFGHDTICFTIHSSRYDSFHDTFVVLGWKAETYNPGLWSGAPQSTCYCPLHSNMRSGYNPLVRYLKIIHPVVYYILIFSHSLWVIFVKVFILSHSILG